MYTGSDINFAYTPFSRNIRLHKSYIIDLRTPAMGFPSYEYNFTLYSALINTHTGRTVNFGNTNM